MLERDTLRLLYGHGIAYVYVCPDERQLGDFDPASRPYIVHRVTAGDVAIYEVNRESRDAHDSQ